MRAIVFNDKGQLVCNEVTPATLDGNVYTAQAKAVRGTNHFYIICNETEELAGKLAQVTRQPDIEQITFSAVGLTAPVPMYGKVTDAWVSSDSDGSNAQVTVNNVTTGVLPVSVNRMAFQFYGHQEHNRGGGLRGNRIAHQGMPDAGLHHHRRQRGLYRRQMVGPGYNG